MGSKASYRLPERAMIVAVTNRILKNFGMKITIRQLYYQLVAHNIIENHKDAYKTINRTLTLAREYGMIPWDAFEDRHRIYRKPHRLAYIDPAKMKPGEIFTQRLLMEFDDEVANLYGSSKWLGQDNYVEVWIEKDALSGFISEVCDEWDVPVVVARGYVSVTFRKQARERFEEKIDEGTPAKILYFGDHDSSGLDIYRNIEEHLGDVAWVQRVALTMDDISRYQLPPNPLKRSDPRKDKYKEEFGDAMWELDALPPAVLKEKVRIGIKCQLDPVILEKMERAERNWRANYIDLQEEMVKLLKESELYKRLDKNFVD